MRSMMARVGPTFGPQLAVRPRMAQPTAVQAAGEAQPAGVPYRKKPVRVTATSVAPPTDGRWTMPLAADLYIKSFIEPLEAIRSYCGLSYEAARNRVVANMRTKRSLSLVLDGRDGEFDDLDRGVNSPGWYMSMFMAPLPAANGQRNTFHGFNFRPGDAPDQFVRGFANTRDFLLALAGEVARRIVSHCAAPTYVAPARGAGVAAGEAQPAGEAGFVDSNEGGLYDNEPAYDYGQDYGGGGPMTEEQYLATQGAFDQIPGQSPMQGMSDRTMGQLFTGIGTIIGGTITGVVDAIRSGNQVRIAEINAATAQYIADARARGNMEQAAAAQRLQAATSRENIQYIREPPPPATGMSTGTMVALGVGAVLVVGLGALFVLKRKRKNPVISDGSRRFFAQPDVAVKYLNDGFSVVGKTSSSRRRRRAAK